MASARERIADLYRRFPQRGTFEGDEFLHRLGGYVFEGENYFLMARGVDRYVDEEAILCPHVIFPRSRQNCWLLWAFSGPLEVMLNIAPYDLEWVGWTRRNLKLRFYRCEEILRRLPCESKLSV